MIPFANLRKQHVGIQAELTEAVASVLADADFSLGRRVAAFEEGFAAFCQTTQAVGVNSGTSALHLALLAAGVGPGDEVILPAFTFIATAAAVSYTGAQPVLADVMPDTLTLNPDAVLRRLSPRTKAIIPVHLYGHPADMDPILAIARRHGLAVIEDAAQAHGAEYNGRRVGSLGDAGCFSFYPAKNLGACGEAGIVVTNRSDWASVIRQLRSWGEIASDRRVHPGFNYRMGGIQAAVLAVKLPYLEWWNASRRVNASHYDAAITGSRLTAPTVRPWAHHVYHIYAVRTRQRALVAKEFARWGVETRVHFPTPIHLLKAYRGLGHGLGAFPEAERAACEVLSIPVHPELDAAEKEVVVAALRAVSEGSELSTLARAA